MKIKILVILSIFFNYNSYATCTLYLHAYAKGPSINMQEGQFINDFSKFYHSFFVNYNDNISSVYLYPGCYLTIWEDKDKGGVSQTIYTHSRYVKMLIPYHNFDSFGMNDKVSSAYCDCYE